MWKEQWQWVGPRTRCGVCAHKHQNYHPVVMKHFLYQASPTPSHFIWLFYGVGTNLIWHGAQRGEFKSISHSKIWFLWYPDALLHPWIMSLNRYVLWCRTMMCLFKGEICSKLVDRNICPIKLRCVSLLYVPVMFVRSELAILATASIHGPCNDFYEAHWIQQNHIVILVPFQPFQFSQFCCQWFSDSTAPGNHPRSFNKSLGSSPTSETPLCYPPPHWNQPWAVLFTLSCLINDLGDFGQVQIPILWVWVGLGTLCF